MDDLTGRRSRLMKWNHELVGVDVNGLRRGVETSRDAVLSRIRVAFPGICCVERRAVSG